MKLINMRCSNCGAELQADADREYVYCSYCGTKLLLADDESIQITNRIIDEARLKEAEIRLKELEYEHERELRQETLKKEQDRAFASAMVAYLAALVISYVIEGGVGEIFSLILVFGLVGLILMRSNDRRTIKKSQAIYTSRKNKWVAFLLCLLFGILGVHYFYVGRVGWGILYIFTFGFFGIGWLIDLIKILCGTFRDRDGAYLV